MTILVAEVIFSNEKTVGNGEQGEDDPIRKVLQIFTCDGQLIVEIDPWNQTHLYNPVSVAEVFGTAGSKPAQPD